MASTGGQSLQASSIEYLRQLHCDAASLERHVIDAISAHRQSKATPKQRLDADVGINAMINRYKGIQQQIYALYREPALAVEMQLISGNSSSNSSGINDTLLWKNYYDQLTAIKVYYMKNKDSSQQQQQYTGAAAAPTTAELVESDPQQQQWLLDEYCGLYFDFTVLYHQFLNVSPLYTTNDNSNNNSNNDYRSSVDYIKFVRNLQQYISTPTTTAKLACHSYLLWITSIAHYLLSFTTRSYPLVNVEQDVKGTIETEFDSLWQQQLVTPWQSAAAATAATATPVDQDTVMVDGATTAAAVDPLYCAACAKLFAKDTVFNAHLTGKKHIKAAAATATEPLTGSSAAPAVAARSPAYILALQEFTVQQLLTLLSSQYTATIEYLQRKQTRSLDEIQAERIALIAQADSKNQDNNDDDSNSNDGDTYGRAAGSSSSNSDNPLNLPLDFNGKPIPYWLYKLHGLHQSFDCEICGGISYQGKREFDKHFSEWRHVYGLKCLGINSNSSNSSSSNKQFSNVTKIADATALHAKLQSLLSHHTFNVADEEELEDANGNVFKKKTFIELQRQGLL